MPTITLNKYVSQKIEEKVGYLKSDGIRSLLKGISALKIMVLYF